MSALQILQAVADELGITRPTSVAALDQQTRQLVALANREGQELLKCHDWTYLQTEFVIEFGSPLVVTGDLVAGSRVVTNVSSTAGMQNGAFAVSGEGMQTAARLATIDGATQVTLTESADITQVGVTLTFTRDTFDMPADYDRYIDQTHWDRRFRWSLLGPTSPQFDQWMRSGIVTVGPRRRWRNVGRRPTQFRIWPPPAASGESPGTLVWEYVSNGWVTKQDGSFSSLITADDDEPIFPDGLLQLGIKWRFFQIKGFDYGALQAEYNDFVDREKSQDGGKRTLSLNKQLPGYLITPMQVQDASFPGPGN